MKRFIQSFSGAIFGAVLGFAAVVIAQSNPGFVNGQVPTAAQWNSYFSGKVDYPMRTVQVINGNTNNLPAPPTGTQLQLGSPDGVSTLITNDSFGVANSQYAGRRANGTNAAPTALSAGDNITVLSAYGYGATGYSSSSRGSVRIQAAENWTDAAQGTQTAIYTTPNGTTVSREVARFGQDGSLTLPVGYGSGGGLVSVGAADSCGTGYKCLRVPN